MGLFNKQLEAIRTYIQHHESNHQIIDFDRLNHTGWPTAGKRNLVLNSDTAVELGNPNQESIAFLIWTDDVEKVENGRVRILGPDFSQINKQQISFGRVVIVGGNGFNGENSYLRFREMENLRYDISLKGYMMRAVPQIQREWSRVSREAVDNGFSFQTLGSELLNQYLKLEYIEAAEVLFVTAGRQEVEDLRPTANSFFKIISAMNKLNEELLHECDACDYSEICDDIEELRTMRKSMTNKESMDGAIA